MLPTAAPDVPDPERFFAMVGHPQVFTTLFDALPEVYLFVKDRAHRYMKVNAALVALHGCTREAEVLGRTDYDFHSPALASQYVAEDREVMRTNRPLLNQVWLVQAATGMPRWYVSSKLPVPGTDGAVLGIAGVMRPYDHAGAAPGGYQRLTDACEYVLSNYAEAIPVGELARRAHLSPSQLLRAFRRCFGMTPGDYVLRVRLLMAQRRLETTADPVGQIAHACGFYDQSHFTRAFRVANGHSPTEHRRRFGPSPRDR